MATKRGWDASSHEALLLCFMEEVKPNKATITKISERMRERGYIYSYEAIIQHVQKLRKIRDTSCVTGTNGPSTPKKATTPRKRATPRKKGGKYEDDDDEVKMGLKKENNIDDDINFDSGSNADKSPSKRRKLEAE